MSTIIEIEHYTKKIHGQTVLNDIQLTMHSGVVYGLQGINGSGKTMLMRAVLGLIHATTGRVRINEKVIGKDISFPEDTGFLLENPAFLDRYSGYDNLKLISDVQRKIGYEQVKKAIQDVGLDPNDSKKYRKYSLGMKQRLGIAAAIMECPDILILDEPTNALDADGVQMVKDIIQGQKAKGALVLIACHDLTILEEMADVIIKIENGCIVSEQKKDGVTAVC